MHIRLHYRSDHAILLRNQENPHTLFVCNNYYYFIFYTTTVAIGIEHVNDYTLIQFEFKS